MKNSQLEFYNEFGDVARFMVDKNFNVKPSDQLENGNYEVNIDLELMGKNSDIDLQSQDDLGDLFASHSTEPEFRFANQILPSDVLDNKRTTKIVITGLLVAAAEKKLVSLFNFISPLSNI